MSSVHLPNPNHDEPGLRMIVFTEFPSSEGMSFDKRPSHFPPAIDIFLWGGLSTSVQEVYKPFARKRAGAVLGFTLPMCMLIVFVVPSVFGSFIILIVAALILTFLAAWVATRLFQGSFDRAMKAVVEDLAPHFQTVGYNITFEKEESCFSLVTFIRFTPYTGGGEGGAVGGEPTEIAHTTDTVDDDGGCVNRDFRVAVFNQCISLLGICGDKNKTYSFVNGRPTELQPFVDKFTWGAVHTEMRPLMALYQKVRIRMWMLAIVLYIILVLLILPVVLRANNDLALVLYLVLYFSLLPILWFSGNLCERFALKRCLGQDVLRQMEEKVQELSPLVEERSGYSLAFQIEKECCCSTGGYIRFERHDAIATDLV